MLDPNPFLLMQHWRNTILHIFYEEKGNFEEIFIYLIIYKINFTINPNPLKYWNAT